MVVSADFNNCVRGLGFLWMASVLGILVIRVVIGDSTLFKMHTSTTRNLQSRLLDATARMVCDGDVKCRNQIESDPMM